MIFLRKCYQYGNIFCISNENYRKSYIESVCGKCPDASQQLWAWFEEIEDGQWNSPNELKKLFGSASILNSKRVVFNIHGNKYRLIVDIEYRLKIVFIVWFGTHKQYDLINTKTISYAKTNKK